MNIDYSQMYSPEDQAAMAEADALSGNLTPKQFEWLLAYTGLDDVWAALEAALKTSDRAAYASVRSQRQSKDFVLADTLAMVSAYRAAIKKMLPDADISDAAISEAWALATRL